MQNRFFSIFLMVLFAVATVTVSASDDVVDHEKEDVVSTEEESSEARKERIKKEIKETIAHHLQDSHDFMISEGIGFPLPVILWDDGLHVFLSSAFHHGETIAESKGNYYQLYHSKIYKVEGPDSEVTLDEHHHSTNEKPLDFSITKNVFMILFMSFFMLFVFGRVAKAYKSGPMPKGAGRFLEPIIVFVRDEIAIPNIGEKHYKRYMSYLLTVFFFIWFLNLMGMTPLGVGVTNNIAVTFSLALVTFIITQVTANKNYWGHIFWMPGVPVPMRIILAPIELLGVIIKPFALMIRLYANMTAGHVVMMSIVGLIFVFNNMFATGSFVALTLFLSVLELLVAALQAYIFTMLTALFFGMAVEEHH